MASNVVREPEQRTILADWKASRLVGAEYCRRHGISYTQFRNWVNRHKRRDSGTISAAIAKREAKARSISRAKTVQRHQRVAKAKASRSKSQATFAAEHRVAEFAEVRLVETKRPLPSLSKQDNIGVLEIVLPTGIKLRLGSSCPLDLLSSVMLVLENC